MALVSVNPATAETIEEYGEWSEDEASSAIGQVHDAWLGWRDNPFSERARFMSHMAFIFRQKKDSWGTP